MFDFSKGLIPAIIVDIHSKDVLMLAYMNEEAYQKTVETKETWFYSRSRQSLWNKGATSGNRQKVHSIQFDCDEDTLLIYVEPSGPACHTGKTSCFYRTVPGFSEPNEKVTDIFNEMMTEINDRKVNALENSYTNYLLSKGIDKIGKK